MHVSTSVAGMLESSSWRLKKRLFPWLMLVMGSGVMAWAMLHCVELTAAAVVTLELGVFAVAAGGADTKLTGDSTPAVGRALQPAVATVMATKRAHWKAMM